MTNHAAKRNPVQHITSLIRANNQEEREMTEYRIVRGFHRFEIHDQYGRCVETIRDPGVWREVPGPGLCTPEGPEPEATDAYIVSLIEQGERNGSFTPRAFEVQRTYDSTARHWSTRAWPAPDA